MDKKELSAKMLHMVSGRVSAQDLLDEAEMILGNPMAVGSSDFVIRYISKQMPSDTLLSAPGVMKGFDNEQIIDQMDPLIGAQAPEILEAKHLVREDKYNVLITPLNIDGQVTGYLSILAVKRPHTEEDREAAKLIASALCLLFQVTENADFCNQNNLSRAIEAILSDRKPEQSASTRLSEIFRSWKGDMYVAVCRYRGGSTANAISPAAREELLNLFQTDVFLSTPGQLLLIGRNDAEHKQTEIKSVLEKYHLYLGISYLLEKEEKNIPAGKAQAEMAVEMADDSEPLSWFIQVMPDFVNQKFGKANKFNQMIHPAVFMLAEYDQEHGTGLCETLRVYFNNKQSIKKSAEILGIHINTVNQRFLQIANLLRGYRFCQDSLFDFYLSLMNVDA